MLEASAVATAIPSLWSAVNSWFTPAVLFLLLNLMIATIALTSSLTPTSPPPPHLIPPFPQQEDDEASAPAPAPTSAAAAEKPPSISILDRVKSLGLFFPSKSYPQQPPPLIPPEEVDGGTGASPMDPFEEQGRGELGSTSPVGKFESFDLYGYLPQEPASEIPRESDPAHYIFEQTHTEEVLLPAEGDGKLEEEEEDGEAEGDGRLEEEEEDGEAEGDGRLEEEEEDGETEEKEDEEDEREMEREVPNLLVRRGMITRSESLNVNLREEEGRGGVVINEGDVGEAVEKRRPVTAREGKGKWGDEGVDARADDFINKFKQQLKLQRSDSIARFAKP